MSKETIATVIDGQLQLEEPLVLPDHTKVRVRIETAVDERERQAAAVHKLLDFMMKNPIDSGGLRFTRDELYDRH